MASSGPLFTPVASPTSGRSSPIAILQETETPVQKSPGYYITPPVLSPSQKKLYKSLPGSSLRSDGEIEADEVIGKYREGGTLYYFARYAGDVAYRFSEKPFLQRYASLVEEYERKKIEGSLDPFDPSAHYVHPLSRVRKRIVNRRSVTTSISSARSLISSGEVVPESEEEDEITGSNGSDDDDDDEQSSSNDDDEYDSGEVPTRRSLRGRTKPKKGIPFSPRKAHSRRIFTIVSDQESTGNDESRGPLLRRSTRSRKGVKVSLDAEAYSGGSEPTSGDEDEPNAKTRSKGQKKERRRARTSRPAYGHFRAVAELDYDSHSDEETASLRKHRGICEKCHQGPAHSLIRALLKKPKGKGKMRKKTSDDEFDSSGDEQARISGFGGWVRCLKCPVVNHWRCLASAQRDEILKAARDRDRAEWRRTHHHSDLAGDKVVEGLEPGRRPGLDAYQTTEFICRACLKGGVCMGCMDIALEPDVPIPKTQDSSVPDNEDKDGATPDNTGKHPDGPCFSALQLFFRCFTCKRMAHYEHLPLPPSLPSDVSLADIADFYTATWLCADCSSYRDGVDKIIAWRPFPPNAVEPPHSSTEPPNYKSSLPRDYLVKWLDRSYRRLQWVPHMWLASTHPGKLKNFLAGGTKVELLKDASAENTGKKVSLDASEDSAAIFELRNTSRASSVKPSPGTPALPQDSIPDAERRIPPAWKTVDRVLDVFLWHPHRRKASGRTQTSKKPGRVESDDDEGGSDDVVDDDIKTERTHAFEYGEQPNKDLMETVSEWEFREDKKFTLDYIDKVVWIFVKWKELDYDQATWDSPPLPDDPGYQQFQTALQRFLASRDVTVIKHSKAYYERFDKRAKDEYRTRHVLKNASDLDLGQNPQLKLMPFQVDGFNWLSNNWWTHQHCILADEMGLGKTVQIATFLGSIATEFHAFPALVVVPNSTITNWVREFERWAPKLRVVPFYGGTKARDIIIQFELKHEKKRPNETGAKFHILITTYEALINPRDFTTVFKKQPRWEVLVIDEGQRIKSDSSLLFKKLNELSSIHRIIMTGTPLNNNIRELFNLMNFLDPDEWNDLQALEKEHEELTEDLVKQLHNRLRPYFLRRIKSEVLQLPPKNEIIVPVSMAPLQKEVYRSILSHNLELLNGLTQLPNSKLISTVPKGRINNILMQLRKCLQHPYLYAEDIEPRGLSPQETHEKLIDASAKLRFLKSLLPKLKNRGHRILIFSQFVIALNVIEDFLVGEGHKFLRLDGNTKGSDRQKDMDEFNKAGSDVFIYLLTTRAGGVGINLFSADTVIIFDPDFNPHQDLQAIARAYRYGQQKTCLVFKLMVKDSAEERIVQVGKKKLVLDHLIVQKMDDADSAGENVESILTYGAQALFDSEHTARDIIYTDHDIDKLIDKTEKEGEQEEEKKAGTMSFSFAKIWAADKDSLEEVEDLDQGDSWAQTLQKITEERNKTQSQEVVHSGRGARRRAAVISKPNVYVDDPMTGEIPKETRSREGSVYSVPAEESDQDDVSSTTSASDDMTFQPTGKHKVKPPHPLRQGAVEREPINKPLSSIHNTTYHQLLHDCGLCGLRHSDGPGHCFMTDRSEHLAEYREMLLLHADDEPWDQRAAAIYAIDETLYRRGHISLVAGQPLHSLHPKTSLVTQHIKPSARTQSMPQPSGKSQPLIMATAGPSMSSRVVQPASPSTSGLPLAANAPKIPYGPPAQHQPPLSTHETQLTSASSSSKRPASPPPDGRSKKKKLSSRCVICEISPQHLVKDCPIVAEGPQSISKQITRLESSPDPRIAGIVQILRNLLSKQNIQTGKQAIGGE